MTTLADLVRQAETARDAALLRCDAAAASVRAVLEEARRDGRARLTVAEDRQVESLMALRESATEAADAAATKIEGLRAEMTADAETDRMLAARGTGVTTAARPAYDRVARVGAESATYRPDHAAGGGPSFFRDLALSQCWRDPGAGERLARHQREVEVDRPGLQHRAIGTGAVVGLVPPAYLGDLYAELARAGRPAADACRKLPLPPEGMTVNISRITTGTSVAVQASENVAVSETNADDTLLTANVVTVGGQQTVSRQAVERGALVEEVLMSDLANAHNAALDVQVITGSGASGQHLGILNTSGITAVTYTDASPTVVELWPKEVDAVRQVAAGRFTGATHVIMNPLMWGYHLAALDTTGRPLFDVGGSNSPMNMLAGGDGNAYQDGGTLLGCKLVQSGGVPSNLGAGTNETRIIAMDARDVFLWEDPQAPVFIRAEQPSAASLGILYVIYSYSAFAAGRQPKAVSVISGTGLIPVAL